MGVNFIEDIKNGNIKSGADFLMACTKSFASDDIIQEEDTFHFIPDDRYKEAYHRALAKLQMMNQMTFEEAYRKRQEEYEKEIASLKERLNQQHTLYYRCLEIVNEIEQWKPPAGRYHYFKKYAIDQIYSYMPNKEEIEKLERDSFKPFDGSVEATKDYIRRSLSQCHKEFKEAEQQYFTHLHLINSKNKEIDFLLDDVNNNIGANKQFSA